ncbi:MAG: DUF2283 domain-containing protein [Candidatus Hodarchaeales archaeon]|jgi:uncharacterized protein YuzE
MLVQYDPEHDILNIEFLAGVKIEESREVEDGIILDFSSKGQLVSIEILDISKKTNLNSQESQN